MSFSVFPFGRNSLDTKSIFPWFFGILLLTGIVATLSEQALGVELNGRLMSDLYAYEQESENHLRPYLSVRADLVGWRDSHHRSLTLHTHLRWTSDLSNRLTTDPQMFVYHAYFKFSGLLKRANLYLGRQFVYCGVGSTLLDGLRVRLKPFQTMQLDLFGGSSVSSQDPEQIRSFSDFGSLGGRLAFQPRLATRVGLSWILRKRDGQVSSNKLGLDGEQTIGFYRLYGRASYNMVDSRLAGILIRTTYSNAGWYLSGEFDQREPSVAANSLFGILDFHDYKQARLDMQRTVLPDLAVVSQLRVDFRTGRDSWCTSFGVRTSYYGLSWHHQSGYGGDRDGVSGFLNLRLNPRWELFSTASLNRYRVQAEQEDRSDAHFTSLGLRCRLGRGFTAGADGQYLRNAVRSHDVRILLRFTKDFSLSRSAGKAES